MGAPSSSTSATNGSAVAPHPMPMAIMRNGHEVIRGAMRDIQSFLEKGDMKSAAELWHKFYRFQELHKNMEEGDPADSTKKSAGSCRGMFQMIDEHNDGAASNANLRGGHDGLVRAEQELNEIFGSGNANIASAKKKFAAFMKENEEHLLIEENTMMPSIQTMMKNGVKVKKHLKEQVLAILLKDEGDIEFFLKFGNEILQRHDNVTGHPRVRVFDHAFWAVATVEQWKQWNVWIKESLPPEKYEEVHAAASWC